MNYPRSGYTLPVFACAAAIGAYQYLKQQKPTSVSVNLLNPPTIVEIPLEQGAKIGDFQALAITRSDPGDNLDLTRDTPIWAIVKVLDSGSESIIIRGGEGIGKQEGGKGPDAIYSYARKLIKTNLMTYLSAEEVLEVTIILPAGRELATRTANKAFGIVEGLSLLGTSGIAQPLSAPEQLEIYRQELEIKAKEFEQLVFCIGENGLDLALKLGINPHQMVKTANWLGPLLVSAGLAGLSSILLFGYHGKLVKLAGGIFHTHHHLADGRLAILTAELGVLGAPTILLREVHDSPTCESALQLLRQEDQSKGTNWVEAVYGAIALSIEQRSQQYILNHSSKRVIVGTVLFDGEREILVKSPNAIKICPQLS